MPCCEGETAHSPLLLKRAGLVPRACEVGGFVGGGLRGVADGCAVKGVHKVAPGKGWEEESSSGRVSSDVADEDEGDVQEGEGVFVAYAEEVDFGGLDEQAESGGEGGRKSRCRRRFGGGVGVSMMVSWLENCGLRRTARGLLSSP